MDDRVRKFIGQQVADGIHNVAEVQRHTEVFVKRHLFQGKQLPSQFNRRYFPLRRDYENIIYRNRIATMKSAVDQENMMEKIGVWGASSEMKVFFRPFLDDNSCVSFTDDDGTVKLKGNSATGLLFIHQTDWQRKLLKKYGCMCLLDATYKTTKYALPLFFLCVKTNVDYIVVATFVTQHEDCCSIAEVLGIIKSWNVGWTPEAFMVDYCEAEINAINSVFKGI